LISVSQDVDNLVSKEWLSEVRLPGLNTRNPNGRNPAGVSSDGVDLSFADRDSVFALDDRHRVVHPRRVTRRRHVLAVIRVIAPFLDAPKPHRDDRPSASWSLPDVGEGQHAPKHLVTREWVGHVPETELADFVRYRWVGKSPP